MNRLDANFRPLVITVKLPCDETMILAVERELKTKAQSDSNKCYGFFPEMPKIDSELPVSKQFARKVPKLTIKNKDLDFNFVRLSLVQQQGSSSASFHLDSDAATALTGDPNTIQKRQVWRLLLNMSNSHVRRLRYLDADPNTLELSRHGNYIYCPEDQVPAGAEKIIEIKPRDGNSVSGVLFCASRVLHSGQDDENGHFVAGYGCEMPEPPGMDTAAA